MIFVTEDQMDAVIERLEAFCNRETEPSEETASAMDDGDGMVYLVHSESGGYSDMEYEIHGVFSSKEKAIGYVESLEVEVWPHVRYNPYTGRSYIVWNDIYEMGVSAKAAPRTSNGAEWRYRLVGDIQDDGMVELGYEEPTFFVTGYELDVPKEES